MMFCFTIEHDVARELSTAGLSAGLAEAVQERVVSRLRAAYPAIVREEVKGAAAPGGGGKLEPASFGLRPRPDSGGGDHARSGDPAGRYVAGRPVAGVVAALGRGGWFPADAAHDALEKTAREGGAEKKAIVGRDITGSDVPAPAPVPKGFLFWRRAFYGGPSGIARGERAQRKQGRPPVHAAVPSAAGPVPARARRGRNRLRRPAPVPAPIRALHEALAELNSVGLLPSRGDVARWDAAINRVKRASPWDLEPPQGRPDDRPESARQLSERLTREAILLAARRELDNPAFVTDRLPAQRRNGWDRALDRLRQNWLTAVMDKWVSDGDPHGRGEFLAAGAVFVRAALDIRPVLVARADAAAGAPTAFAHWLDRAAALHKAVEALDAPNMRLLEGHDAVKAWKEAAREERATVDTALARELGVISDTAPDALGLSGAQRAELNRVLTLVRADRDLYTRAEAAVRPVRTAHPAGPVATMPGDLTALAERDAVLDRAESALHVLEPRGEKGAVPLAWAETVSRERAAVDDGLAREFGIAKDDPRFAPLLMTARRLWAAGGDDGYLSPDLVQAMHWASHGYQDETEAVGPVASGVRGGTSTGSSALVSSDQADVRAAESGLASVLADVSDGQDCAVRLELAARLWHPRSALSQDDSVLALGAPEARLASRAGGQWRPAAGALDEVTERVRELGPGATAFLLSSPPDRTGITGPEGNARHAYALRNEGGRLYWVETQALPGQRFQKADPSAMPSLPVDTRVIVVGPDGRAVPNPFGDVIPSPDSRDALAAGRLVQVPVKPSDPRTVDASTDRSTFSQYGAGNRRGGRGSATRTGRKGKSGGSSGHVNAGSSGMPADRNEAVNKALANNPVLADIVNGHRALGGVLADAPNTLDALTAVPAGNLSYYLGHPEPLDLLTKSLAKALEDDPDLLTYVFSAGDGYGLAALKKLNGDTGLLKTVAKLSFALLELIADVPGYAGIITGHRGRGGNVRALLAQLTLSSSIQAGLRERADLLGPPSAKEQGLLVRPDVLSTLQRYGVHARIVVKTPGMLAALAQSMSIGDGSGSHLLQLLSDQAARGGPVLSDVLLNSPALAQKLAEWPDLLEIAARSRAVAAQLSENPLTYDDAARKGKKVLQATLEDAMLPDWVGKPAGSQELQRALARAGIVTGDLDEQQIQAIQQALGALEAPHEFRRLLDTPYLVDLLYGGEEDPVYAPGVLQAALRMPAHTYNRRDTDDLYLERHDDLDLESHGAGKFGKRLRENQAMQRVLRGNPLLLNYLRAPEIAEAVTSLTSVVIDAPFDERVMNLRRVNKQLVSRLQPTPYDPNNAEADRLMSVLLFDDASLLRILTATPEIVDVFVERLRRNALQLQDDVSRLHQHGLLRYFAQSPDPLMTAAHWDRLLSDDGLASLLGRLVSAGQGEGGPLAKALARRPSLLPDIVERPGTTRPDVEETLTRALAEEDAGHRETLLAQAIKKAGDPVLTPEGVKIVPALLPTAKKLLDEHPRYSLGLALALAAQEDLAAAMETRPTLRDLLLRSPDAVRIVHDYPRFTQALLANDDLYQHFATNHRALLSLSHLGEVIDTVIENPLLLQVEAEHSKSQLRFGNSEAFRRLLWERGSHLARALSHSETLVLDSLGMYDNRLLDALASVEEHKVHAAVLGHGVLLWLVADEPGMLQALIKRPALAGALASVGELSRDQYLTLLGEPKLANQLNDNPEMAAMVLRSQELLTEVVSGTSLGKAALSSAEAARLLTGNDNLRKLAGRDPLLAQRLTESAKLASVLASNFRLARVMVNDDGVRGQVLNSPDLLATVIADPDLVTHRGSMLWELAATTPKLARVLKPDMSRALAASADLARVTADLARDPDRNWDALPLPGEWEQLWRAKGLPAFLGSKQRLASQFLTNPGLRKDLGPGGLDDARRLADRDSQALETLLRQDPGTWPAAIRAATAKAETAVAKAETAAEAETYYAARGVTRRAPAPATMPRRERPAGRGEAPGVGAGLGLLEGHGFWLADALAVPDPRLAGAVEDNRLLLPLLAADPDAASHLAKSPEQHGDYQYKADATRDARDDFTQWLASTGAAPAASAYDTLRAAAATVHALASYDREHRLAAIREADSKTWQLSGEILYVGKLEEQFTEADIADLKKAATGVAIREGSSRVVLHQPLHTHLRGGSGGAAFTFVITKKDAAVAALVYARSTARSGNAYRWEGHHSRYMDGPPGIDFIHNTEAMKESRELLEEAERRQKAERRGEQLPARPADSHEAQRGRIRAYHHAVLDLTRDPDVALQELNAAITVLTPDERTALGVGPGSHPRLLDLVTTATTAALSSPATRQAPAPMPGRGRKQGRGAIAAAPDSYVARVRARLAPDSGNPPTPGDIARRILTPAIPDAPAASAAQSAPRGPGNQHHIVVGAAMIPASVSERFGRALQNGKDFAKGKAKISPGYWLPGKPVSSDGWAPGNETRNEDWGSDAETVIDPASDNEDWETEPFSGPGEAHGQHWDSREEKRFPALAEPGTEPPTGPTEIALVDVLDAIGLGHLAELIGKPGAKLDPTSKIMERLTGGVAAAFRQVHRGEVPPDAHLILRVEMGHSLIAHVVASVVAKELLRPIYIRVNGMRFDIKICW